MTVDEINSRINLFAKKYGVILLALFLLMTAALATSTALEKSVTIDEYALLPNGLAVIKEQAFHIDAGVPPLPKVLFALPVLLTPARFDASTAAGYRTGWQCGIQFAAENPSSYHDYFLVGRLVSIIFLLITILLTYGLANSLYGPAGGLFAAFLAGLSPNLLAHGCLATTDIYLAAAVIGALWAFDYFLRKPGLPTAAILGLALGLACLCKLTGILLLLILPLAAAVMLLLQDGKPAEGCSSPVINAETAGWGLLAAAVAIFTINLGYLFQGSFSPLGEFQFSDAGFQLLQRILPSWLPVPFPYYYFLGFDLQLSEKGYDAYLLGRFNDTGFWDYYLVGFLVKTPVPVMVFAFLALVLNKKILPGEIPMLAVLAIMFTFFSLVGHKNIGIRYLLFIIPIICVWTGRLARSPFWRKTCKARNLLAALLITGSLWVFLSAAITWPDYLAYFNIISGGPDQGHKYLLDSNIDMGQDLIALKNYLEKERIPAIDLAYFGRVPPEYYGINYRLLKTEPARRYAVISTNLLWGKMYFVNGSPYWPTDREEYAYLRPLTPKTILGHSLYVYDMQAN